MDLEYNRLPDMSVIELRTLGYKVDLEKEYDIVAECVFSNTSECPFSREPDFAVKCNLCKMACVDHRSLRAHLKKLSLPANTNNHLGCLETSNNKYCLIHLATKVLLQIPNRNFI